ncbi:uncharacterized protein LOC121368914 [Gigantopelta aegis]|uniref:uncharacterized protein LOC121368914 n=1 Tax=Gigantopelta aegis TaxID=1735272 RepID=UPI001B889BF7|nr:uncharacterized protein LOC121368914 [Gigantopelta aegis]
MANSIYVVLFSIVCIKVSLADDPCQTYKSFPSEDRRDTLYELGDSESPVSDKYIAEAWYGSLMGLATSPPGAYKCGTFFPVWAKQEVVVGDGSVDVTVCTQIPDNDCAESFIIKAKECGSYKVYDLKRTAADSSYCFAAKDGDLLCSQSESSSGFSSQPAHFQSSEIRRNKGICARTCVTVY